MTTPWDDRPSPTQERLDWHREAAARDDAQLAEGPHDDSETTDRTDPTDAALAELRTRLDRTMRDAAAATGSPQRAQEPPAYWPVHRGLHAAYLHSCGNVEWWPLDTTGVGPISEQGCDACDSAPDGFPGSRGSWQPLYVAVDRPGVAAESPPAPGEGDGQDTTPPNAQEAAEAAAMDALRERDDYHDDYHVADRLALLVGQMTGVDIGEHSSMNDPWGNAERAALDWLDRQREPATPPNAQRAAEAVAAREAAVRAVLDTMGWADDRDVPGTADGEVPPAPCWTLAGDIVNAVYPSIAADALRRYADRHHAHPGGPTGLIQTLTIREAGGAILDYDACRSCSARLDEFGQCTGERPRLLLAAQRIAAGEPDPADPPRPGTEWTGIAWQPEGED